MLQEQIKAALRQAAQEIIEQFGAQRLTEQLMKYPQQIRDQAVEVSRTKRAMDDAKADMEQVRAVIMAAVTAETNGGGKAVYGNDKAREAEATRRTATDEAYLAARKVYREHEDVYNAALFEKTQLENEFGAMRDISQMVAAQLNWLAGMSR